MLEEENQYVIPQRRRWIASTAQVWLYPAHADEQMQKERSDGLFSMFYRLLDVDLRPTPMASELIYVWAENGVSMMTERAVFCVDGLRCAPDLHKNHFIFFRSGFGFWVLQGTTFMVLQNKRIKIFN